MGISNGEFILGILLALFFGACICGLIYEGVSNKRITLSQETADKICLDLTNESGVVAKDYLDFNSDENKPIEKGELYCQIPSYDEKQLIKVGN